MQLEGVIVMWSTAPAATLSVAVPVAPASVAVTVWPPATEAVHELSRHEPSGAIEKVAAAVTSPSELP